MTVPGQAQSRPQWRIDDVLARTDLAQILDQLADPATHQARGRRWHCPMPGHDDRNASVTMHTDHHGHQRWRCWSGDNTHRGDAIDLVTNTQHLNRTEAIDWLAHRAGMIPDHPLPPVTRKPPSAMPTVVTLDPVVARYAHACERILWGPTGTPVRDWLHARGFTNDTIRNNHLGADPGRQMMRRARGLPYGSSIAATLPALDPAGEIRYVQTRYLQPGDRNKYDNPAATLATNPRLAWTRTPTAMSLQRPGVLVVCEGIPDALTAAQAGYQSVGILGSQAPDHTVAARLANQADTHHQHITAIIDADPAGRAWGQHLGELLTDHGHQLHVIEPPEGLDLNTWAQHDNTWSAALTPPGTHTPAEMINCPDLHARRDVSLQIE